MSQVTDLSIPLQLQWQIIMDRDLLLVTRDLAASMDAEAPGWGVYTNETLPALLQSLDVRGTRPICDPLT